MYSFASKQQVDKDELVTLIEPLKWYFVWMWLKQQILQVCTSFERIIYIKIASNH